MQLLKKMSDEHFHTMRLQRFLARAGVASRRGSERLISEGRVVLNGKIVRELGTKVCTETDSVEVDGKEVHIFDEPVYGMLYKPKGYLSTMKDPRGRKTVADLVDTKAWPGIFCAGRLDKDTTGLLLFTTDGDMAERLLHPRFEKEKHYIALVQGEVSLKDQQKLETGIFLEDGKTAPAKITLEEAYPHELAREWRSHTNCSCIGCSIHEGKKHIVKRMCEAVGHPVLELHRDKFGPLKLKDIAIGQFRLLAQTEIDALHSATTI